MTAVVQIDPALGSVTSAHTFTSFGFWVYDMQIDPADTNVFFMSGAITNQMKYSPSICDIGIFKFTANGATMAYYKAVEDQGWVAGYCNDQAQINIQGPTVYVIGNGNTKA